MRIVQVVPSIKEEASGPSYSVLRLTESLVSLGKQVELHVLAPAPERFSHPDTFAYPARRFLKSFGVSSQMKKGLRAAARRSDIMHNHSIWMMPNIYPGTATRGSRCRLVMSPRGTLSKWAVNHSRWRKKVVWSLWQKKALLEAACLHATAESEYLDIRRAGLKAPVAIIPNGVDIPESKPLLNDPNTRRRLLFLSRIHPKKGIPFLLKAWRAIQHGFPDWELWVVGPSNIGYSEEMQELSHTLGCERVVFPGAAYGEEKKEMYRSADLYVLPTHSENFGIAVAEALSFGVPAVVTKGAPWMGLEKEGCGWWIDIGEEPLAACLREAMASPPGKLAEMGARGRSWVRREFAWERIGEMMLLTYEWLVHGGARPDWVRLD